MPRPIKPKLSNNQLEFSKLESAISINENIFWRKPISQLANWFLQFGPICQKIWIHETTRQFSTDYFINIFFSFSVSLQSLNLISNPFNCNCHMAWFADWLRTKGFTAGGPRCAFPPHLKDRPIHALPSHEFRCTGKAQRPTQWPFLFDIVWKLSCVF